MEDKNIEELSKEIMEATKKNKVQYCIVLRENGKRMVFAGTPQVETGEKVKIKDVILTKPYDIMEDVYVAEKDEEIYRELEGDKDVR